jgi:tRNA threonylcarbamoyladenosine biosynthesis protein TsaB
VLEALYNTGMIPISSSLPFTVDGATAPRHSANRERIVILALDTSTEYCSVALLAASLESDPFGYWSDIHFEEASAPRIYTRHEAAGTLASARLLPLVQSVFHEAALELTDCDVIVFGAGPGSFTGLRTAVSVAQGLAYGLGIPVVPVCTLMACAEAARMSDPQIGRVISALDARMGEVYWGRYDWQGASDAAAGRKSGADSVSTAPMGWVGEPLAALDVPSAVPVPESPYVLVGNATEVFGMQLSVLASAQSSLPHCMPHAAAIARLGWRGWRNGLAVTPADAVPLYVRDKVAQTTFERIQAALSRNLGEIAK